jgi:hypothetical protein
MNNIFDTAKEFDKLIRDQKQTLKSMDRLINLAEQLLNDVTAATQRSVVL